MAPKRRPCARCGVNRDEKFYVSSRGRVCLYCRKGRSQLASRAQRLWESYGITEAEFNAVLAFQGGVCAICKGRRTYNLDWDHDHALERAGLPLRDTGRGCLCKNCNRRVLRAARDSIEILEAAIEYLKDPPARKVLGPASDRTMSA